MKEMLQGLPAWLKIALPILLAVVVGWIVMMIFLAVLGFLVKAVVFVVVVAAVFFGLRHVMQK